MPIRKCSKKLENYSNEYETVVMANGVKLPLTLCLSSHVLLQLLPQRQSLHFVLARAPPCFASCSPQLASPGRDIQGERCSLEHIKATSTQKIASHPHPASKVSWPFFSKFIAVTGQKSQPWDLQFSRMVFDIVQLRAQQLGY